MVNKTKASLLIVGLVGIVALLIFGMVMFFSSLSSPKSKTEAQPATSQTSSVQKSEESKNEEEKNKEDPKGLLKLDNASIEEFLQKYLTYQYLGDNRNQYKAYMTPDLFDAVVNQEEKPVNQAQKELIVNQEFDSANIYIDVKDESAICQVYFTNDNLQHKPTVSEPEPKSFTMNNNQEFKLSFVKNEGHYLVSAITYRSVQETNEMN